MGLAQAVLYLLLAIHLHAHATPSCGAEQRARDAELDDSVELMQMQMQQVDRSQSAAPVARQVGVASSTIHQAATSANRVDPKSHAPEEGLEIKLRQLLRDYGSEENVSTIDLKMTTANDKQTSYLAACDESCREAKLRKESELVHSLMQLIHEPSSVVPVSPPVNASLSSVVPAKNQSFTKPSRLLVTGEEPEPKEDISFQGEGGELKEDTLAEFVVVPLGLAVLGSLFVNSWLEHHHIAWFPESLTTVCLGAVLGLFMKAQIGESAIFEGETFNETMGTMLMLFLLPILMFDAGWSLRKKDFASQFEYVLSYAVIGSLISFIVVGLLIVTTGGMGLHSITTYRTAFGYAALVAATDPVSTLATFSHLRVDPLLNILTFGDSVFNDAVAIILFKVLNSDAIMGTPDSRPSLSELSLQIAWGIIKIFSGSVVIGLFMAGAFLFLLRAFDMDHAPKVEILALTTLAYVTFGAGEVFEMSGIISTVFCSIVLGIYARTHLSDSGLLLSNFFIKELAQFMDTTVFILVGFCVVQMGTKDSSGWIFGLWVMLFCLVGRFCAVVPVTYGCNFLKRKIGESQGTPEEDWHLISPGIMYMMWHAGLRGAIALTLCMEFGTWVDELQGPGTRKILQTATYIMIVVFLLVFGGTTQMVLNYWEIPMGDQTSPDRLYKTELPGVLHNAFEFIDEKIMTPLFIGEDKKEEHLRQTHNLDKEVDAEDALKTVKSFKRYSMIGGPS